MKQIFVGSSAQAERHARDICNLLSGIDGIKGLFWRDAFPLGFLTFEGLERMLATCAGAVLLVTPGLDGSPSENVMLEFGLVAGRMGRTNVALCKLGEVPLPSDLLSLTYIEIKSDPAVDKDTTILSDRAGELLRNWAVGLSATIDGVPVTQVVHGYTGRWAAFVKFNRFREIPIVGKSIATMESKLDLIIPPDGQNGYGMATADIFLHLEDQETHAAQEPYQARFKACAAVSDVTCLSSGAIRLRTQTFSRQRTEQRGTPWPGEGLDEEDVGPWNFNWTLTPEPNTNGGFRVVFETDYREWSQGEGEARKEVGPRL